MPDDTESISIEDILTDEDRKEIDEAHEESKEDQPSEGEKK